MLLQSPEFVSKAVLGFAPCPENSRPSHEPWKKLSNALLHQLLSLFATPCGVVSGKFYPQHVFHNIEYGRLDSVRWLFSSAPHLPFSDLGTLLTSKLSWFCSADPLEMPSLFCMLLSGGGTPLYTFKVEFWPGWWWPSVKLGASLGLEPAWPGARWMLQAMLLIFNGDGAAAVGVNGWQTDGTGRW